MPSLEELQTRWAERRATASVTASEPTQVVAQPEALKTSPEPVKGSSWDSFIKEIGTGGPPPPPPPSQAKTMASGKSWNAFLADITTQSDIRRANAPDNTQVTGSIENVSFDGMTFDQVFGGLIQQESRGRHRDASGKLTTSPAGATGITQLMPKTMKNPGYGVKPLQNDSEEEYLRFGKDYLRAMLKEFGGDVPKALAAYNGGAGAVKTAVRKAVKDGKPDTWLSYIKSKETRNYVPGIHAKAVSKKGSYGKEGPI